MSKFLNLLPKDIWETNHCQQACTRPVCLVKLTIMMGKAYQENCQIFAYPISIYKMPVESSWVMGGFIYLFFGGGRGIKETSTALDI